MSVGVRRDAGRDRGSPRVTSAEARPAVEIDVVTPTLNYGSFLADAIDSVASQGSWRGAHVISDGGSSDGTTELLQHRAGPSLLWESRPDAGQSDALNRAVARASGEWIGWLNADEFYLPDALETVSQLVSTSDVDVVFGDCAFVNADGRFVRLLPAHPFSARLLRLYGCFIPSCATFIRRSLIAEEGWSVEYRRAMDWELWLRLACQRARFLYVPKALASFRIHPRQVTATPEHAHRHEFARLAHVYGLRSTSALSRLDLIFGQLGHATLKVRSGGYRRQLAARRRLFGTDLRWWASSDALRAADVLTRL